MIAFVPPECPECLGDGWVLAGGARSQRKVTCPVCSGAKRLGELPAGEPATTRRG